jgi:hypothetical protein
MYEFYLLCCKILAPGLSTNNNNNSKIWNKIPFVDMKTSNEVRKVFKNNNISPAFYNNKSIGRLLVNTKDKIHTLNKNGVYKLDCDSCNSSYIGKTKRALNIRIKEHTAAFKNKHNDKSNFANHLLVNNHSFNIDNNVSLIHQNISGYKKLGKLEILEINRLKQNNNIEIINEQLDFTYSPLLKPLFPKS